MSFAVLSPICNLSVALFSARVAQHVILTLVAAPLLVVGQAYPSRISVLEFIPRGMQSLFAETKACWFGAFVFALAMWFWHAPAVYDATFKSSQIYWTMHITMMVAALFWDAAFRHRGALAGSLLSISATMLQMSLLGALLTFARRPLFSVHALTTVPWGMSPADDQQLGGLIMWVVGGMILSAGGIFALFLNVTEKGVTAIDQEGLPIR